MQEERTKTIIHEIQYWKENRLLPSEYCDFLLALYTKGEEEKPGPAPVRSVQPLVPVFVLLSLFLIPLTLLVIYFTEMGFIMQTGLLSFFVGLVWFMSGWLHYKRTDWYLIPFVNGLLIIFSASIFLLDHWTASVRAIHLTMLFHFFLWIFLGWLMNIRFLLWSGVTAVILWIFFIVL